MDYVGLLCKTFVGIAIGAAITTVFLIATAAQEPVDYTPRVVGETGDGCTLWRINVGQGLDRRTVFVANCNGVAASTQWRAGKRMEKVN